jgi:hypothetical protein
LWAVREERQMNKVVARYADGRIAKGTATDFSPAKDLFHMSVAATPTEAASLVEIRMRDLKAVYFVKDLEGNRQHTDRNEFDPTRPPVSRPMAVTFKDGEVLVGTTTGYQPGRPGFFFVPADATSNIEHCYIVTASTRTVRLL